MYDTEVNRKPDWYKEKAREVIDAIDADPHWRPRGLVEDALREAAAREREVIAAAIRARKE